MPEDDHTSPLDLGFLASDAGSPASMASSAAIFGDKYILSRRTLIVGTVVFALISLWLLTRTPPAGDMPTPHKPETHPGSNMPARPPLPQLDKPTDHTYTTKSGVALPLRIWSSPPATGSDDANADEPRPWLFWTHGGAWAGGAPYRVRAALLPAFVHEKGYHLVSAGYRLAPHVSIEEQLQDSLDAYDWARAHLPRLLADNGAPGVDLQRFAVGGESAGGTLTTLLGHKLAHRHAQGAGPAPRAVVDLYGVASFPLWLQSELKRAPPPAWKGEFSHETIVAFSRSRDHSQAVTAHVELGQLRSTPESAIQTEWGVSPDVYSYTERHRLQSEYKAWADLRFADRTFPVCLRWEEGMDEAERTARARRVSSLELLDEAASAGYRYPATAFLHGRQDTVVPVEQSEVMAAKLRSLGVDTIELYDPDGGHGFDSSFEPGSEGWNRYIQPAVDFVHAHITSP